MGRATILYRRQPQQWYLAKWKAKPLTEASFVREGYFDTPRLQALLAAFKSAHGGDEDARGLGFAQALPRGGRASPARTFSPARRADPSEAGAGADLNC